MVLCLDEFSTELLLKIFKYLDIYDLCRLKQTCKRFNEIIENWGHSLNKNVKPLVTNQVHSVITDRSLRLLSPFERLRVSRNWRLGIYKERAVLFSRAKYMPWLHLEKDLLWVSRGSRIYAYERSSKGINTRDVIYNVERNSHADVCHFVKKNNCILSGQTDGSIWLWSVDKQTFTANLHDCHRGDVDSVDMMGEIIVSGSRDNLVKIWNKTPDNTDVTCVRQIDLHDRVWSVAISEEKSLLAIGSAGLSNTSTITIYDMTNQTVLAKFDSNGLDAGVLDLQWENSSILWSSGYDGFVRRWDLRTSKCEQGFGDPCGASIYCFQYDYFNSMISGTNTNGRAVLWDTRQVDYVQLYFMDCCRRRDKSSPVYSLSYDADFLFAATDRHVNILDFSIYDGRQKDYSNLFIN